MLTVALFILGVVFLVAAQWAVIFAFTWSGLRRKQVVVVLDDERTITGVMWKRSGPLLFLRAAQIATDTGPVKADGMIVVERSRVLWMQVT